MAEIRIKYTIKSVKMIFKMYNIKNVFRLYRLTLYHLADADKTANFAHSY